MKILITGIYGFVGSNLVSSLKEEYSIYGIDIVSPVKEGIINTFSWKDLEEDKLPDVDMIIHLAGKAHDVKNQSAADSYFQINTELTKTIYNYFLKSTAKKFIFFSSVKAAADFVPGDILTEDIKPMPIGPYGESKIKAEEYILSNLPTEDKRAYILRPCMIHGPGNKGNLNLLYGVLSKGIPWPLGAFENRRSFTSIDNLVFLIKGLLSKDVKTGIYNVGDDEALSTNELVDAICSTLGKNTRIWRISQPVMKFAAKLGTLLHLPLNTERLTKLTENYVVSNAKIKKALDVEQLPVSAADGLAKTIKSFQN